MKKRTHKRSEKNDYLRNYYWRPEDLESIVRLAATMGHKINIYIAKRLHDLAVLLKNENVRYDDAIRQQIKRAFGKVRH